MIVQFNRKGLHTLMDMSCYILISMFSSSLFKFIVWNWSGVLTWSIQMTRVSYCKITPPQRYNKYSDLKIPCVFVRISDQSAQQCHQSCPENSKFWNLNREIQPPSAESMAERIDLNSHQRNPSRPAAGEKFARKHPFYSKTLVFWVLSVAFSSSNLRSDLKKNQKNLTLKSE